MVWFFWWCSSSSCTSNKKKVKWNGYYQPYYCKLVSLTSVHWAEKRRGGHFGREQYIKIIQLCSTTTIITIMIWLVYLAFESSSLLSTGFACLAFSSTFVCCLLVYGMIPRIVSLFFFSNINQVGIDQIIVPLWVSHSF